MKLEKIIITKLKKMGITYKHSGDNYLLSLCLNPKHKDSNPSFSINTTTGFCKCFTCGFRVESEYWTDGVVDEEMVEEIERDGVYMGILDKPNKAKCTTDVFQPPKDDEDITGWRGLTKETINKFGLYKCSKGKMAGRVILPINKQGHYDARAVGALEPKYKHSYGFSPMDCVYPLDFIELKEDYVVVVEGILDCIMLWQSGIQAVCNFGVAPNIAHNNNVATLTEAGVEHIYIMFDKDKYGIVGEEELIINPLLNTYFEVHSAKRFLPLDAIGFYKSEAKDFCEFIDIQKEIDG